MAGEAEAAGGLGRDPGKETAAPSLLPHSGRTAASDGEVEGQEDTHALARARAMIMVVVVVAITVVVVIAIVPSILRCFPGHWYTEKGHAG